MAELDPIARVEEFLDDLAAFAEEIRDQVTVAANAALSFLTVEERALLDQVGDPILDRVATAEALAHDLSGRIRATVAAATRELAELNDQLSSAIVEGAEGPTSENEGLIGGAVSWIGGTIAELSGLDDLLELPFISGLLDELGTAIDELDESAGGLLGQLRSSIGTAVDEIDRLTAPLLRELEDSIPTIASGIAASLAPLADVFEGGFGILGDALSGMLKGFFGFSFADDWLGMQPTLGPLIEQLEETPFIGDLVRSYTAPGFPILGPASITFVAFLGQAMALAAVQSALAGEMEQARQWSLERARPTNIGPAELRELANRRPDNMEDWRSQLAQQGYDAGKIDSLLQLRFMLLNESEIFQALHREELTIDAAQELLARRGWEPAQVELLELLSHPIPPVQDIIRMAVREVFNAPIREAFGADLEIDPDYLKWAAQTGLSEYWARNYWAAHWELPSLQMGYQMLHRRVIDDDQLSSLFTALDIMPGWRDALTAISYKPLTRVDVRRMHALGLLDDAELQLRYQDLGYDPENAAMMVAFTIAYNADPEPEDKKRTQELTRAQIMRFLAAGYFEDDVAVHMLMEIGYDSVTAHTWVDLQRLDEAEREQDQQVRIIKNRFRNGVLDYNGAVLAFDALELTPTQRAVELSTIEAERAERVNLLSRSELDALWDHDLIQDPRYLQGLRELAYPEAEAELLLELQHIQAAEKAGKLEAVEPPRLLPRSLVVKLLKSGAFTGVEALERLQLLGFGTGDAELIVRDASSTIEGE